MLECADYPDFDNRAKSFAIFGYAISEISTLEHQLDTLILAVNESNPVLASRIDPRFPRHFEKKIDFVIRLVAVSPALKQIPIFGDGALDLQWLDSQLTEIFGARTALTHGEVSVSIEPSGHPIYRMIRFASGKKEEPISKKDTAMGAGFLADLVETTKHLAHYFSTLTRAWKGEYNPDEDYQQQREIDANWKWLNDLAKDRELTLNDLLNLKTW